MKYYRNKITSAAMCGGYFDIIFLFSLYALGNLFQLFHALDFNTALLNILLYILRKAVHVLSDALFIIRHIITSAVYY